MSTPFSSSSVSVISRARMVARVKWGLLVFAGMLLAALILWPLVTNIGKDANKRLTFTSIESTGETEKPGSVMINPHFQGVDKRNRPFTVTAETAYQEGEDKVLLTHMEARLETDKGWYALKADLGHFYISRKTLDVLGSVIIASDDNIELVTDSLHVNMDNGTVSGIEPVTITAKDGTLTAQGISMEREASEIRFDGRVEMVLYPPNGGKRP